MKIGVDMDGVLSNCIASLLMYHNKVYRTNYTSKQVKSHNLRDLWEGTKEEEIKKVYAFFKSPYFRDIKPISGSIEAIDILSKNHELFVITARPYEIEKETKKWVKRYFPNMFRDIILTNEFCLNGNNEKKIDVCFDIGAELIIEDCLANAIDCAINGLDVYLINAPWNKSERLHARIERVKNWKEIINKI